MISGASASGALRRNLSAPVVVPLDPNVMWAILGQKEDEP